LMAFFLYIYFWAVLEEKKKTGARCEEVYI
jgi:hypothetical protein